MKLKGAHSKMENINYSKLEIQKYLNLAEIDKQQAQLLFKYRVRMAKYSENFRGAQGPSICPLCSAHLDSQKMTFENCQVVKKNVTIYDSYSDIFKHDVSTKTIITISNIEQFRKENIPE